MASRVGCRCGVWSQYGPAYGLGDGTLALVALAAFAGHVWPVFFGFKGGKGVATAAGVLFGIQPLLGLATCCHLADRGVFSALFITGGIGQCRVCTGVFFSR
jgi:glycerol-3-phosphate acyltransferase PlsY